MENVLTKSHRSKYSPTSFGFMLENESEIGMRSWMIWKWAVHFSKTISRSWFRNGERVEMIDETKKSIGPSCWLLEKKSQGERDIQQQLRRGINEMTNPYLCITTKRCYASEYVRQFIAPRQTAEVCEAKTTEERHGWIPGAFRKTDYQEFCDIIYSFNSVIEREWLRRGERQQNTRWIESAGAWSLTNAWRIRCWGLGLDGVGCKDGKTQCERNREMHWPLSSTLVTCFPGSLANHKALFGVSANLCLWESLDRSETRS